MLSHVELIEYQRRLLGMMSRLQRRLTHLRDEAAQVACGEAPDEIAAPPLDFADQGSHEFEVAVTLGLADNEQHLLEEIDAALERIEAGTFGRCERCGQPISKERLRALPYSCHCVHCMEKTRRCKATGVVSQALV